ncbi:hypothetical protein Tco_0936736 [Tanacetum coccineum]|uniref:Retrotransposon gag domain-containing protein n=1 Tax=Tanacetum coccineum TaxID=301880 RepID=A0ABQ5DF31_9ASTR
MPSHVGSYNEKRDLENYLYLFEGSILNYEDLKEKFRSHFSQQKKFTKTHLAVHNIKQREGESTRAFVTRYIDDTLQILGLHEEQRIFGFVHGLKTRSLVEFLSTDLPTTYKGLIEKTYIWIEAREVATNGTPNDHRESFDIFKKNSSWDNNKGKKNIDKFSPYRGSNHGLLSNLSKSPREILETEKVAKAFKQPIRLIGSRRSRDMTTCTSGKRNKKGKAKALDTQLGEWRKGDKDTAPVEAPILMLSREDRASKRRSIEESVKGIREITFPPISGVNNSFNLVIIKVQVSGRQVNQAYMHSGSSCEVIYEYCFLKLKPSIRSLRVYSKVPLIGFLGQHSWPLDEVPLEITMGESPFARTKVLNFIIVRPDSPHNLLLGRTAMQRMGIVVSTIHRAIKFHTPRAVDTVFSTYELDKIEEGLKKLKEASLEVTKDSQLCGRSLKVKRRQPVKQKKRGLAPEQNEAICKKVEELTNANILREVKYQTSVSNPAMIKKDDGRWKLCVDFTDINKARPKDCYPLLEFDQKVEPLYKFHVKCFLDANKGCHQIQTAKGDEEKTASSREKEFSVIKSYRLV